MEMSKSEVLVILKRNPLKIVSFGFMIYYYWRLFNAKSFLYTYIKYIGFGLIRFYGMSSIVGYLMPNRLYTLYIKYIGFGLVGF